MTESEPKFFKTVGEDLRRGDFKRTLRRDFEDLKQFYLSKERRDKLAEMKWAKRWFFMSLWLLKILFLRLTPTRRLLLLMAVFFVGFSGRFQCGSDVQFQADTHLLGYLLFLFVLMLELKDKLLARSELEAGRVVQHALLPDASPQIPGWSLWLFTRPANEIGGDLVDYIQLNKKRFGVVLADVAGKGLGAALFMAKLQATLRAVVTDYDSLTELGQKINSIFHQDSLPNSFASLVYLELQANSGQVRFINAGHMPPVMIRRNRIKEMPKGEPALGLLPDSTYKEHSLELEEGDILLVYSDGLTEAQNELGEFFGEQRLFELLPKLRDLSPQKLGERLLQQVDQFIADARVKDDLSLCVLTRQSRLSAQPS